MLVIESAGITDIGRKRSGNEDALLLDDELFLYLVADGMGGHQSGEIASAMVVASIHQHMQKLENESQPLHHGQDETKLSPAARQLLSSIEFCNRDIYQIAQRKDHLKGMGSTVSAVHFSAEFIIAANVGDSPIFRVNENKMEVLSIAHTFTSEHAYLFAGQSANMQKAFGHVLTRAIGTHDAVKIDITEYPYENGDTIVISSDGLSNKVSENEIWATVRGYRPEQACQSLIDLANRRGGEDNVTVIVLNVLSK